MADLNAALMQQILDVTERQRESDIQHDGQLDDVAARTKVAERVRIRHRRTLRGHPALLKTIALTAPS